MNSRFFQINNKQAEQSVVMSAMGGVKPADLTGGVTTDTAKGSI
jgi:hypothetical protein